MEIREFLELPSSRLNADILADRMGEDTGAFDLVWEIMLEDRDPVSMRAAWSISLLARKHPSFIEPRIPAITGVLPKLKSASVKRSLLKLLTLQTIPEEQSGFLFDYCYDIIESADSPIAHTAYAMTILYNISEMEPGLKPELISLLETRMDDLSEGLRARSRKLIKKLSRDLSLPQEWDSLPEKVQHHPGHS
jgi:hypothetical protein